MPWAEGEKLVGSALKRTPVTTKVINGSEIIPVQAIARSDFLTEACSFTRRID